MTFACSQQMKKEFKLPIIPGATCGEEMLRRNYHRAQILKPGFGDAFVASGKETALPADQTLKTTTTMLTSTQQSGQSITGNNFKMNADSNGSAGQTILLKTNTSGQETVNNNNFKNEMMSAELAGKVLRFYAFYLESVPESAQETSRVRKSTLHYYLEDDTMSVTESLPDNSGFAFRGNLKRHIVPSPDGAPITYNQLNIGEAVTFYGRTYFIYDVDAFTRAFLEELGCNVPLALEPPTDEFMSLRSRQQAAKAHSVPSIARHSALNNLLTPEQIRATQQFLAHDGKVLRCDCTWDDTASLYGCMHYFTLYYFLCDGSMALVEKEVQNSGRDAFPTFFRRQRVAKPTDPLGKFDSTALGSLTFVEDKNTVYYDDRDIRIGNVLDLFGRKVKIHSYDAFTQNYLCNVYGVQNHTPLPGAIPPPFIPPSSQRREPTEEEKNEATMHKANAERMRRGRLESSVVKFLMRLDNNKYEDAIRRFVLAVYPADETVSIFEPIIRNSGIVGGKFLQRQRVKNAHGVYYTADDFYVGARVCIHAFPFVILSSDEHSLNYMEHNTSQFTHSDINKIVRKLQALLRSSETGLAEALRVADEHNTNGVQMSVLLEMVNKLHLDVSEQEILTVLRFFDKNNESYVSYEEIAARILPEGDAVAQDNRPWQQIYEESLMKETEQFVSDPKEAEEKRRRERETITAAHAATEFSELYEQRRQLFIKEFRAVVDYARDSLIGVDEFKLCTHGKLHLNTINDEELNALCAKLFPPSQPRVTFEEFMRLINNTSTFSHNLSDIISTKSY